MATITIDATTPSATINLSVLNSCLDRILEADRRGQLSPSLAPDEYVLINELRFAVTTGKPSANAVSQIVLTY